MRPGSSRSRCEPRCGTGGGGERASGRGETETESEGEIDRGGDEVDGDEPLIPRPTLTRLIERPGVVVPPPPVPVSAAGRSHVDREAWVGTGSDGEGPRLASSSDGGGETERERGARAAMAVEAAADDAVDDDDESDEADDERGRPRPLAGPGRDADDDGVIGAAGAVGGGLGGRALETESADSGSAEVAGGGGCRRRGRCLRDARDRARNAA